MNRNPLNFIESASIPQLGPPIRATPEGVSAEAIDLDKLPTGVVSGNTLIDYSGATSKTRAGLSLALTFANQAAFAELGKGADEDDRFAAYKSNLSRLGFNVSQGAFVRSTFK